MSKSDTIPSSMGSSKPSDSVAIFSGGLDSTTLVYHMLVEGLTPHLVSFNYGQRHKRELEFAARTGVKLGLRHDIIDLTMLTHLISNSALTSNVDNPPLGDLRHVDEIQVPEGHYAEDNMKLTVVPNRNMIMLSIAAGIAVNNGYKKLATGVHAGDHFVYPDCRPEFIQIVNAAIMSGNKGFGPFDDNGRVKGNEEQPFVYAPFLGSSKADIAYEAMRLEVPLHETWSCYKGGEIHCGKCGTCVERLEAIAQAENAVNDGKNNIHLFVLDETEYEDTEYWKEAIANANS